MTDRIFDIVAMGRSSIDLYANDVGVPFEKVKSFAAYVGGCPTNISVGTRRLGLRSALLTAIGDDPVGDFILHFLRSENVETEFIPRKPGHHSSAVIMGIEPPDKFPLVFYRENCADMQLTIDDVLDAPIDSTRMFLITGTGLSREPSRCATIFAAQNAKTSEAIVILDLDFRPDQWVDVKSYGVTIQSILPFVDIVIGSQEEAKAVFLRDAAAIMITHSQMTEAHVSGDLEKAVQHLLSRGPKTVVIKQGESGSTVYTRDGDMISVPPFAVTICNVLGAGDAFASGFIYGYLKGWDLYRSARMGNACGAILVTRHGCANFMPYEQEVDQFVGTYGGL